jgi:hypothetical protein
LSRVLFFNWQFKENLQKIVITVIETSKLYTKVVTRRSSTDNSKKKKKHTHKTVLTCDNPYTNINSKRKVAAIAEHRPNT